MDCIHNLVEAFVMGPDWLLVTLHCMPAGLWSVKQFPHISRQTSQHADFIFGRHIHNESLLDLETFGQVLSNHWVVIYQDIPSLSFPVLWWDSGRNMFFACLVGAKNVQWWLPLWREGLNRDDTCIDKFNKLHFFFAGEYVFYQCGDVILNTN